ncbi:hypothetical protein B0H19DRAFT_165167 [Mycena capillaripes]|nr:hypothetical protein B0H19DRAFT_165167 [Mycena capillaripes]
MWQVNGVLATKLAHRYGDQGVVSTSVNPGNLKADIAHNSTGSLTLLAKLILILTPRRMGCNHTAEAAYLNGKIYPLQREGQDLHFIQQYIVPRGRVAKHRHDAEDPNEGMKLWNWLEE